MHFLSSFLLQDMLSSLHELLLRRPNMKFTVNVAYLPSILWRRARLWLKLFANSVGRFLLRITFLSSYVFLRMVFPERSRTIERIGTLRKTRRQRQRERHQRKGLMSRTIAVHVHYNSTYISLPSCAKQQREMTKFCVVWRT